jgi:Tol biopolymer transport system component
MPNASLPFANSNSGDGMLPNLQERAPGLSADGRYVVFASQASNLVVGDNNGVVAIFLRDRIAGTTQRISLQANGVESVCDSRHAPITPDARYAVFSSCGNLA